MATIVRVPVQTITLARETKEKDAKGQAVHERITPPIGEAFEFSAEEIDQIEESNPGALRAPVNEVSTKKVTGKQVNSAYDAVATAKNADTAKKILKDTTGVDKLKDVKPDQYAALLEALNAARSEDI